VLMRFMTPIGSLLHYLNSLRVSRLIELRNRSQ
jgi:hypothetical protein